MQNNFSLEMAALVKHGYSYQKTDIGTGLFTVASLDGLPGVAHGFSTREGGVSFAPRDSLNLHWAEDGLEADVIENYRRFAKGAGLIYDDMAIVNHEHGNTVLRLTAAHRGRGFAKAPLPRCDGIITDDPAVTLVTSHADCGAIFLYDPVRRAVGMAHAGWKGTLLRIGGRMARMMREEFGCDPNDLIAAAGPCICKSCFEVDEALAEDFVKEFGCAALRLEGRPTKAHVDLQLAVVIQLINEGVLPEHITLMDACTYENEDKFFSHRRDRGGAGSMAAFIKLT